ncbi:MAG: coproporphyrinogen III oxidase, partial [Deltaproteobacteria bacterium]|nr:coproporphyrinogen III oxidase [Deltaproteobacteria bacterium]
KIRKWTIIKLICHFYLSFSEFERQFGIPFKTYFETELIELEKLEKDRLVEVSSGHIQVLDFGKILVRNVCMVFDAYLRKEGIPKVEYSKTI